MDKEKLNELGYGLLPGWFSQRMLEDSWCFGILTSANQLIMIEYVERIWQAEDGSVWLDANLLKGYSTRGLEQYIVVQATTNRRRVSINTTHVVAAFELAGSAR
jgi:hypothetical protein